MRCAESVGHRFTLDQGPVPGSSIAYWGRNLAIAPIPALEIDFQRPGNVDGLQLRFERDAARRAGSQGDRSDLEAILIPVPVRISQRLARRWAASCAARAPAPPPAFGGKIHGDAGGERTARRGRDVPPKRRPGTAGSGLPGVNAGSAPDPSSKVRRAADAFNGLFAVALRAGTPSRLCASSSVSSSWSARRPRREGLTRFRHDVVVSDLQAEPCEQA